MRVSGRSGSQRSSQRSLDFAASAGGRRSPPHTVGASLASPHRVSLAHCLWRRCDLRISRLLQNTRHPSSRRRRLPKPPEPHHSLTLPRVKFFSPNERNFLRTVRPFFLESRCADFYSRAACGNKGRQDVNNL